MNQIEQKELFPRCEYYARYEGTTYFKMNDPEFWHSYFRTTHTEAKHDRMSTLVKQKTYNNNLTNVQSQNDDDFAHSGTYSNPFSYDAYINAINDAIKKENTNVGAKENNNVKTGEKNFLYDNLLNYKQAICKELINKYDNNNKNVLLHYANDYPCILVKIKKCDINTAMAYLIEITNKSAENEKVPIELVLRASFGHNGPSIDKTGPCIRINIGIVPKIYTKILASSLKTLDFLIENLSQEIKRNKKNFKTPFQVDLLVDYIINKKERGEDYIGILSCFLCEQNLKYQYIDNKREFAYEEHESIPNDTDYWCLLEDIFKAQMMQYNISNRKLKGIYALFEKSNFNFIRNSINNIEAEDGIGSDSECECEIESQYKCETNIKLYSAKLTVTTGMRAINLATYLLYYYNDGLNQTIIAQTIPEVETDTDHMYFETKKAVEKVNKLYQFINFYKKDRKVSDVEKCLIVFFDLTMCETNDSNGSITISDKIAQIKKKDYTKSYKEIMFVLDYTSATTKKIKDAIRLCFNEQKTNLIVLVNSGLKNEQQGADMNPYGTIRIVSRNSNTVTYLYTLVKDSLVTKESLPKIAMQIRKAYKNSGFSVSNQRTFDNCIVNISKNLDDNISLITLNNLNQFIVSVESIGYEWKDFWNYLKDKNIQFETLDFEAVKDLMSEYFNDYEFNKEELTKFALLLRDCEDIINLLIQKGVHPSEFLRWGDDKIKCAGKLSEMCNKYYDDNFDSLIELYCEHCDNFFIFKCILEYDDANDDHMQQILANKTIEDVFNDCKDRLEKDRLNEDDDWISDEHSIISCLNDLKKEADEENSSYLEKTSTNDSENNDDD